MGDKLLSAVGLGKAEASPAVLAPQLMGAQAGVGVLLKKDAENQNNLDWPDERWNTSTVSKPALDLSLRSLLGRNPDDKEVEESGYHYPVTRSRTRKTETLVEQEGEKRNRYTFPKLLLPLPILFAYKAKGNLGSAGKGTELSSTSGRLYDHDYEKHRPKAGGSGAAWNGASINPIPDVNTGQRLLDSAYSDPKKPRQFFNYYDRRIIKFRTSGDGRWHAYEVNENVNNEVGSNILKQFVKDKLISAPEYKKLLRK